MDGGLLLAPGAALAGLGAWRLHREGARRRAARAGWLDGCRGLFADVVLRVEPHGFPRLAGSHGGARFDLRAVPDALAMRKLPALWLLATITEPQPVATTAHLMLRPRGSETWSRFAALPLGLPPLPGLPPDHAVRGDGPAPAALALPVGRLGAARVKEVVAAPRGLRVTWLAEEADRGRYLLFRDAELGRAPLDPDRLRPVLEALLALRDALG